MPGRVPGIHALLPLHRREDVDGRDKPGHDKSHRSSLPKRASSASLENAGSSALADDNNRKCRRGHSHVEGFGGIVRDDVKDTMRRLGSDRVIRIGSKTINSRAERPAGAAWCADNKPRAIGPGFRRHATRLYMIQTTTPIPTTAPARTMRNVCVSNAIGPPLSPCAACACCGRSARAVRGFAAADGPAAGRALTLESGHLCADGEWRLRAKRRQGGQNPRKGKR